MKENKENNVTVEVEAGDEDHPLTLYKGTALYEYQKGKEVILLQYTDDEKIENRIRFSPSGCILQRKGQDNIRIHLSESRNSYIEVSSELGVLRFDVETEMIYSKPDYMKVRYVIPGIEEDQDGVFSFTWRVTGHLS